MKIKRIEIQGFKSFAEKQVLELNPRTNVIVGPNGSGKSNLIDAVNWVLGEQSPRTLRGERMEDIIFSGSAARKPVGMAQVSLYIDNSQGDLPLEYHELTITRRFFRSGESQFLINKIPCRLKDIRDLFLGTGSGRGSLAIISQGQVDQVLNAKPSDRRQVFEEAAGISKYRIRCQEAKNQLSRLEGDAETLSCLAAEIENSINLLRQEAGKAERYLMVREEKNRLESVLLTKKAKKLYNQAARYRGREAELSLALEKALLQKKHFEELLEIPVKELEAKRAAREEVLREGIRLGLEKEHLSDRMQMAREKKSWLEGRLRESSVFLERSSREIHDLELKYEEGLRTSEKLLQEIVEAREECSRLEDKERETQARLILTEKKAKRINEKYVDALREQAENSNLLSAVEKEISINDSARDKNRAREAELEKFKEDLKAKIASERETRSRLHRQLAELNAERAECDTGIGELEHKLSQVDLELVQYREKHSHLSSRQKLLGEMQKKYEGYAYPVQELLNKGRNLSGICGVVGDLLEVPETFRVAIEIALGGKINNIVTETTEDARAAIAFLKQRNSGRLTFLPLDMLQSKEIPHELRSLENGFPAADIVKVDARYQTAVNYLLGRILVVEDLETGLYLAGKTKYKYTIVTVQGEVIHPGGALTGGSVKQSAGGVVGRRKNVEQLAGEIARLEGSISALERKKAALEKQVAEERQKLRLIGESITKVSIRIQELDTGKEYGENQIKSLDREARVLEAEYARLEGEREEKALELAALSRKGRILQRRISRLKDVAGRREQMLNGLKKDLEDWGTGIKNVEVKLSALEQKYEYGLQNLDQLKELQGDMVSRHQERSRENTKSLGESQKLEGEIAEISDKIKANELDLAQVLRLQEELEEAVTGLEKEEAQYARVLDKISFSITNLQQQYSDCRHRLASVRSESKGLEQYLEENQGLELLPFCLEKIDEHILHTQVAALRKQMQNLEPVNLSSIEEYSRIEQERAGLAARVEDIKQAQKHLGQLIHLIEKRMGRQFGAFFARLQHTFNDTYQRVFGGGTARLQLQGDALEGVIEITVQPPGKRAQSLMLLSGGERALTALTLLFAIIQENHSPFCVLDEVDTSLDENNIEHFTNLLEYYSDFTQFIVVSHRQGTMEAADNLFGVTMPEDGVSAVVSVNLEREAG